MRSKAELRNLGSPVILRACSILQRLPINSALDRYLNNQGATAARKTTFTKFLHFAA